MGSERCVTLSLGHLQAIIGTLAFLSSFCDCQVSQGIGVQRERAAWRSMEQPEYANLFDEVHCLTWVKLRTQNNGYKRTSKTLITDHHNKYSNNEKVWNIVGETKQSMIQKHKVRKLLEKWYQETCLTQRCRKLKGLKTAISVKHDKEKCNKRWLLETCKQLPLSPALFEMW